MCISSRGGKVAALMLALLICASSAQAVIKVLTPLRSFLNDSTYVLLAKVDKFYPDKPAIVLLVEEDFKGKAPFRRLPVNIKADKEADKEQHIPKLLKRLGPDLPIILFVNERAAGKRLIAFAFTNGTWFQMSGQKTGPDTVAWSLTNAEPYLRRTFKGTTAELKKIVIDSLAGKAKPPEANPKEEPGFGPEIDKKTSRRIRIDNRAVEGPLFAVIPTLGIAGPLAILAILFPSVFGGMPILFRRWMAYVTVISVNSLLLLFFAWPWFVRTVLRDRWLDTEQGIWFTMILVTALCTLWAWRRQLKFLERAEDDVPPRTERMVLLALSLVFGLTVLFYLVWMEPKQFQMDWNMVLVLAVGIWFATLVRVGHELINRESLARSTEGLILGATLLAYLGFAVARWGTGTAAAVGTFQAADNPSADGYVEEVKQRWTFQTKANGYFVSTGLIHGDKFYIASAHPTFKEGALVCLDRNSGKEIWKFEDEGFFKPAFSSPAIADGRLYIGEGFHDDANCKLYCVDTQTGQKIWEFRTTGQTESSPVVANGKVYFGAGNAGKDGNGGPYFTDGFYCVNTGTKENVLNAKSKDMLWKFPKAGYQGRLLRFCGSPAVVGNRVYIGSGVDRNQPKDKGETALFCLDADTGEQRWKVEVDLPSWAAPVVDGSQAIFALGNGDLFTDADKPGGAILCLDPATGNEIWRVNLPNGVIDQPAVDKNNVYFGCRDMHVYCLDRRDGNVKWKRFMQSPVVSSVARAGGDGHSDSVIAAASDGLVCALDAKSGDVQWSFDLTPGRAVLVSSPQVVVERTRIGERRQIYFGAGIGGGIQTGDSGSGPAAVFCLENRLVQKTSEKNDE